jgi:uncharacterized membrane protein
MATIPARKVWLVPAGLVLLSLAPALAGTGRLIDLSSGGVAAANERFAAMPLPVTLHILAAIPFSLLGAFQFSTELRRRYRTWHRMAGRVLVVLGLVVALSGLWMTLVYPWANHDGEAVYMMRLVVGMAMTAAILLALDAVRRRDFIAHGEWMIRGYAIALGAGTQVLTHLPWFVFVGEAGELSRAVMMGAAWAINAVVAEWIIRSARHRREHARTVVAATSRRSTRRNGVAEASAALRRQRSPARVLPLPKAVMRGKTEWSAE